MRAGQKCGQEIALDVRTSCILANISQRRRSPLAGPGPDEESNGRLGVELAGHLKIDAQSLAAGFVRHDPVAVYIERRYEVGRIRCKKVPLGPWLPKAFFVAEHLERRLVAGDVAAHVARANQ